MRYGSVCSGIEAASVAWRPLGWECAFVSEIDKFPAAVLKERFPEVPNLGDFSKIQRGDYSGDIDLLVGGTPCQAFSIAGLRKGLKDERGNLALEFAKLAYRTHAKWVVWENVPMRRRMCRDTSRHIRRVAAQTAKRASARAAKAAKWPQGAARTIKGNGLFGGVGRALRARRNRMKTKFRCAVVVLKVEFPLYREMPENAIICGVFQGDFVLIGLSAERGKRETKQNRSVVASETADFPRGNPERKMCGVRKLTHTAYAISAYDASCETSPKIQSKSGIR